MKLNIGVGRGNCGWCGYKHGSLRKAAKCKARELHNLKKALRKCHTFNDAIQLFS
jgi:hypothetical protein